MKPHKFQFDMINAARELLKHHRMIIFNLPTGGGKGFIIGNIAAQCIKNNTRAWITSHRIEIHKQLVDHCLKNNVSPGQILSGQMMTSNQIQVAMIQTLYRKMKYLKSVWPDLIMADEAHHNTSKTNLSVLNYNNKTKVIGFTATPQRSDGAGMKEAGYTALLQGPQTIDLVNAGYLTMPVILSSETTEIFIKHKFKMKNKEYDKNQLTMFSSEKIILNDTINMYNKHFAGAPCIIFCCSVEDSKLVASSMRVAGWRCEAVYDGLAPELRKKYIDGLSTGEIQCITNYSLISEGIDIPILYGIIMRRKTASLIVWLQACGRPLRKSPGKHRALIIDQAGNIHDKNLGHPLLLRNWNLDGKSEIKDPSGMNLKQCFKCGCWVQKNIVMCPACGENLLNTAPVNPGKIKIINSPLFEIKPPDLPVGRVALDEADIMCCEDQEIDHKIIDKINQAKFENDPSARDRLFMLGKYFNKSNTWMDKVWNDYYLRGVK